MRSAVPSPASRRMNRDQVLIEQALLALMLGFAAFFFLAVFWLAGFQIWNLGKIYPGVNVAGVQVGGLNPAEAAAKIAREITFPQSGHILLSDGDKTWAVTPLETGLFLDAETSAKTAFSYGRSGSLLRRLDEQFRARQDNVTLPPNLIFDQRMAFKYLAALAAEVNQPLIEPSISIENASVAIHAGQPGRTVDIPATLEILTAQMQTLRDGIVPLTVTIDQPATMDLEAQAELARHILAEPLVFSLPPGQEGAGPWSIEPADVAAMLVFEHVQKDQSTQYQVALSSQKLREFLTKLAPQLQLDPAEARFIFNDDTRQLELIQPAVIGRALDIENSLNNVQAKVLAGEHTLALDLVLTPPRITDQATAEQLGITGLVHAETSYFYGSDAARVQNIEAAASRFHGLLIAPGETFSMAGALGDISLDNGYAEALIIYGNQTIKGVGGGVCQVSTTLFRTAFFAGFPIVERYAHAYRVSYYEKTAGNQIDPNLAGLDATVFVPLVDLKFTNDTPHWLLMETYVSPAYSSITWKFYSTPDGRSVQWDTTGPVNIVAAPKPVYRESPDLPSGKVKQVDWPADGADITVNRRVYKGDALYFEDAFHTHYEPWQAIYEYGPGTEGMPPPETHEDGEGE
ncbi:MAG: VanW family protein [Anaerolineaceae bacterium]|nr:VanW family protein [Anaerolineaceae bacterium]